MCESVTLVYAYANANAYAERVERARESEVMQRMNMNMDNVSICSFELSICCFGLSRRRHIGHRIEIEYLEMVQLDFLFDMQSFNVCRRFIREFFL